MTTESSSGSWQTAAAFFLLEGCRLHALALPSHDTVCDTPPRLEYTLLSVPESHSKDDEPKKPSEPLSYNLAEKFAIVGVLETLTIGTLLAVARALFESDSSS